MHRVMCRRGLGRLGEPSLGATAAGSTSGRERSTDAHTTLPPRVGAVAHPVASSDMIRALSPGLDGRGRAAFLIRGPDAAADGGS